MSSASLKGGKILQPNLKADPQGPPACLQLPKGTLEHHSAAAELVVKVLLPGVQSAGVWLHEPRKT